MRRGGDVGFVLEFLYPKGPRYCYGPLWGILPQIIVVIPNMETLHSTISVHRTLWDSRSYKRIDKTLELAANGFGNLWNVEFAPRPEP